MKEYLITQEQLEEINFFKRMFELNADLIQDLCNTENDSIKIGFELGKIHSNLRNHFMEIMELENKIINQKVIDAKIKI